MELQKKSFGSPDEVRPMADKGRVELVRVGDEPCVVIDFAGMEHYAESR